MKLLLILYNIILVISAPLWVPIAYITLYFKGKVQHFSERLGFINLDKPNNNKNTTILFHAASVGEVRSIHNLITKIREKNNNINIAISTMTSTGRDIAINEIKADYAFLIPIENKIAIRRIVKKLNVKLSFIVDTEIWPNMIITLAKHTKLIMINARISDKTFNTYYFFKPLFAYLLKQFTFIFAKSNEDKNKIDLINSNTKTINLGNIKFQKRKNIDEIKSIENISNLNYLLIASTHSNEEEIFINAFKRNREMYDKLIIAPRHINRAININDLVLSLNLTSSLYSNMDTETDVIVIDKLGMLEPLYITASKIFIGGSIVDIGGHNIYEALQFSRNVATGKHLYNFKEVQVVADEYSLINYLETGDDIDRWLTSNVNDKNLDFISFFEKIDTINSNVINKIIDTIQNIIKE